jgi:hypothetical protein
LTEQLARELTRRLPFVDMGSDFLVDEAANGAPELLVLAPEKM